MTLHNLHNHYGYDVKEIDVRINNYCGRYWTVEFLDEIDLEPPERRGVSEYRYVTDASMQRLVRLVQGWQFSLDCENGIWTFVRPESVA